MSLINNHKKTVVVGLSGGVDSSVTALLLKQQGYRVIGLFMKNWDEGEECPWVKDYEDVTKIAEQLQIPCYTVNFTKEYWERVFARCLEQFRAGTTPNPDILCNQEIKFKLFFEKARSLGADYLATGHYARKIGGTTPQLGRALDETKDQSYFLYTMRQEVLQHVLFPLGDLRKSEVRALARAHNLITAEKKDSVGICFIGKRDFKEFLSRFIEKKPGNLETLSGRVVGTHEGASYYTIGQRRGLEIGGPGEAWFVVGKDMERNVVYVEQGEEHPLLYRKELFASSITWIGEEPRFPLRCTAKIRYRSEDQLCTVTKQGDALHVLFDESQKAVTPQQSIVFYQEEICLGGGIIKDYTLVVANSCFSSTMSLSPPALTT